MCGSLRLRKRLCFFVSHETWVARLGSDPGVVGRTLQIDTTRYTIVGVLPRGLTVDRNGAPAAYWIPAGQDPESSRERGSPRTSTNQRETQKRS